MSLFFYLEISQVDWTHQLNRSWSSSKKYSEPNVIKTQDYRQNTKQTDEQDSIYTIGSKDQEWVKVSQWNFTAFSNIFWPMFHDTARLKLTEQFFNILQNPHENCWWKNVKIKLSPFWVDKRQKRYVIPLTSFNFIQGSLYHQVKTWRH